MKTFNHSLSFKWSNTSLPPDLNSYHASRSLPSLLALVKLTFFLFFEEAVLIPALGPVSGMLFPQSLDFNMFCSEYLKF